MKCRTYYTNLLLGTVNGSVLKKTHKFIIIMRSEPNGNLSNCLSYVNLVERYFGFTFASTSLIT